MNKRIKLYLLLRLWREQDGQDLTEYALLLMLVALGAIAGTYALGDELREQFVRVAHHI
jgi:Flp pilus assembly pilin Flp